MNNNQYKGAGTQVCRELASKMPSVTMWVVVLIIYLIILLSIGYVSFWEQDFNRPELVVEPYVKIINEYNQQAPVGGVVSDQQLSAIIQEVMKKNAESASEVQALASQSFHIVLGAVLSFLSGSVTMISQRLSGNNKTG
ncbi:hypothetical protein EDC56_2793 [Sinobacterium caligoides]|uniref:Uncharacterized protein n=1 Tax=Sinobacterium caligoides TaxID=933926 RepID=A0A3N2DK53_9GAMM|nr:hypothetical protein [Sinobacterium caligoides]ROS00157.1 hypothetical protein EDC56_2793 [Sinobacterium caligoides]